jgi:UTP--glucose-1-phosphate uridylyltransferase
MQVRKAVIAAAGFGTRFLPQTKAMPKEMLPIVDKPIIQYIVEQLVDAGITDIIIVTGYSKRSIEDHFDAPNDDLLNNLRAGGPKKEHYIRELDALANIANFAYVRQKGPYGNATPLMSAAHLIGNEPFMYIFADDLTIAEPNGFKQMIDKYNELGASILPCIKVQTDKEFSSYGILGGEQIHDDTIKMNRIVEKPGRENAPSDFASVGGYLLTPDVLGYIDQGFQNLQPGHEFYMTDSIIQPMIDDGKVFYGYTVHNSTRYDTGDKIGYLKAVVDFALNREDIGADFREYLKSIQL